MYVSGLQRLVEAVEVTERAAAAASTAAPTAASTGEPATVTGFVCPVVACGRIFSKKFNRQAHMRLHDGSRPFACNLCNKTFMWKSSLKSHARMHAKLAAGGGRAGVVKKPRRVAASRTISAAPAAVVSAAARTTKMVSPVPQAAEHQTSAGTET